MAPKRVTIDQLAAMVANGFQALQDEMREGFRQITGRLNGVEGRLGGVEGRLGGVEGRLDGVEGRLGAVEVKQEEHSRSLNRIERKLDSTIARVDDHGVRIERLERHRPNPDVRLKEAPGPQQVAFA